MKVIDLLADGITPGNLATLGGVLAGHAAVLSGVNNALNDKAANKKPNNATPVTPTTLEKPADPKKSPPAETNSNQSEIKKDIAPTSDDKSVNGKLFHDRVKSISKALGVRSSDLLRIMEFESGMDPAKDNGKDSGAVGLIQFMPDTIKMWPNLSRDKVKQMPASDQLLLVYDFYKRNNLPAGADLPTMYMFTYMPAAANKPDDFVLAKKGAYKKKLWDVDMGKNWDQNSGFAAEAERQGRDYFTVGDVKKVIQTKR